MYRYLYIRLPLLISIIFSISLGYENLYLMQFDNVSKNYQIDYLTDQLPELIKNNYSNEEYINILYAPKIIPTLYEKNSNISNGILINGKFLSSYDNIIISFEAFDVESWEKKAFRSYYCSADDNDCIENALLICIRESVLPIFCPYYDCFGVCNGSAISDCSGECNGDEQLDCFNVCGGDARLDCTGVCNGTAVKDNCGSCDYDLSNDCTQDCNGDWGGNAFFNICNVCVGGNTGAQELFGMDCLGNCHGQAYKDCNGDCLGDAYVNECNVCVGGNTGNDSNQGFDCDGVCFGTSIEDKCGRCNGDNSTCSDCLGVPYGNARLDNCGICDTNPSNDCIQDCNGAWGGDAYLNKCLICVEGDTGFDVDKGLDCNNECWGDAKLDSCGICNGNNDCYETIVLPNHINNKSEVQNKNKINNNKKYLHTKKIIYNFHSEEIEDSKSTDFSHIDTNTANLFNLLDNLKYSLYKTNINKVDEEFIGNRVQLKIPVNYSIDLNFLNMFSHIPHIIKENINGTTIYEIEKKDFSVSTNLDKHLSLMKYQVVPVLFFANNNDEVQTIIINSWNDDYIFNFGSQYNIDINLIDQFKTLVSITPGPSIIQFNFDNSDFKNIYEIHLSEEDYMNFEYIFVDFFYEHSLETDLAHYISNLE